MERTIDGIDYIAKSEVLAAIYEGMARARFKANDDGASSRTRYAWAIAEMEITELYYQLGGIEEA